MSHHHNVEFITIDGRIVSHFHQYSTTTSYNDGHSHHMSGLTSYPIENLNQHVHYYEGTTSLEDGHVHHFRGWTGPPLYLPNGEHYHEFRGETTYDDGHTHSYYGRTSRAIVR